MADDRSARLKAAELGLDRVRNRDTPTKSRIKHLLGEAVVGGGGGTRAEASTESQVVIRGGNKDTAAVVMGKVLKAMFERRLRKTWAKWVRAKDWLGVEESVSSARSLLDAAMEAQKFVAEQAAMIEKMSGEAVKRDIEIGKKDELIDKIEKEKKAQQQELKLSQAQATDYKRRAGVLGFQVKKLLVKLQNISK
ncbi:hypothetical protein TrVE_jg1743 [Triparma verrucosa]|uniref:Uncharacterized protein n=1 Tax=Triparma verrucosa TaxID=1606542 RepID=A0A9W7C869_9STRA|nr:hypothetical protein TrVE_jg1743 [Triparma verrucosa]